MAYHFLLIQYITMKIRSIHIFIGLLAILAISCYMGKRYVEGMTSGEYTQSIRTGTIEGGSAGTGEDSAEEGSLKYATQQRQALRNEFDAALRSNQLPPNEPSQGESAPTAASMPNEELTGSQISRSVTGPRGEAILATPQNTVQGIPRSKIPAGQEDLYILKSEIVPPVCPACPSSAVCPREKPCPPCPACERCPEPAFECKKVPNYRVAGSGYLPQPVLTDFSQFGM